MRNKSIVFFWTSEIVLSKGGIHRVTYVLMNALEKLGYKCYYLYSDNYKDYRFQGEEDNVLSEDLLQAYLVERNVGYIVDQNALFSSYFTSVVESMKCRDQIKLISVFHNTPLLNDIVFDRNRLVEGFTVTKSWRQKFNFILMLMGYPLWKRNSMRKTRKQYHYIYDHSDKLVLLSERFVSPLCEMLGEKELPKCIGIPNPLSFDTIETPSILGVKQKEVLIVSRLYNQEKRINLALDIWKLLEDKGYSDWRLKIVGTGFDDDKLIAQARRLYLKNVSFEGRQDSEPYYKTASLFMLTSKVEGWGLTLTESQQNGVVPIAFDSYHSLHDIITDDYDGCIVPNGDIRAFADRMGSLMSNTEERERLALNGLESCKRYTMDKVIEQWINLIETL